MNLTTFLSAIIFGTLTGNVLLASGIGVDLVSNNLNSIKNALVFSLFVVGTTFFSGVFMWLANLWLMSGEHVGFIVMIGIVIVAVMVQIADFIMMKTTPIVHTYVKDIMVILIPSISIIIFSLLGPNVKFFEFIFNLLFCCVGMALVMVTISGVRQNKLTYATYDVFKGNLMTLVVLFVMALVWTAF